MLMSHQFSPADTTKSFCEDASVGTSLFIDEFIMFEEGLIDYLQCFYLSIAI